MRARLTRMRKPWKAKAGLALLAAAVLFGIWFWLYRRQITVAPAVLPIDRETTYLTEPLGPDGGVDYAAALNAAALPPPEENAALPILEALGTDALVGERSRSLALLGAPPGPAADGLLAPYPDDLPYFDTAERLESEEDRAAVRNWLEGNDVALDRLLAASRRPRMAWPFARDGEGGMLQAALDYEAWESLISALQKRADLHLVDGKPPSGWSDIRAELRLSRLLGQQPLVLYRLFELGLRSDAQQWVGRALASGALDGPACAEIRQTLETLPTPRGLDPTVLNNERLVLLDAYISQVADGIRAKGGDPGWHPANVALAAALREINVQFDQMAAEIRPTAAESLAPLRAATDKLRESVESISEEVKSFSGLLEHAGMAYSSGGAHQGTLVGKVLALMVLSVVPMLPQRSLDVESHRHLVVLALALKMHELRTGAFPGQLADLGTGIVPEGSLDLASVVYERDEKGCRLEHGEEEIEIAAGAR